MRKIAVLMGGLSSERAVSLDSGRNIADALASLGKYDVVPVVLESESLDGLPDGVDAVYIALHGGWGENGGVQAALNARKIPYTGPGVEASRIAMDKILTKERLEAHGIATPPWAKIARDAAVPPLPLPVVVKPPADGSSVGISKVSLPGDWARARDAAAAAAGTGPLLVETFIPGREMTVGVIDGKALPAIEIVAKDGWYGFDEKYRSDETRYPFLADGGTDADRRLDADLRETACAAFRALGCRGVTRVDFRVAPDGRAYVLELNTSPGFTAHSLVPKAGMKTGLSFAAVCDAILSCATCD